MITVWKTPVVTTVEQVVADLKLEVYATGLLRDVNNTGSDLMCTCPFHGNGREHNPSLGVLLHEKVLGGKKHGWQPQHDAPHHKEAQGCNRQ